MTAEPMRLERVLCRADISRPDRPASVPGEHCNRRASIACEVDPALRPTSHPTRAADAMTAGNGTAKNASASNEQTATTAIHHSVMARRPTRISAWTTMAITAGPSPRKMASTTDVSPYPT